MEKIKNLTDPIDIRYAIEKKYGGYGYINNLAKIIGTAPAVISQNINKHRNQISVLRGVANYIGCAVHNVEPDKRRSANKGAA